MWFIDTAVLSICTVFEGETESGEGDRTSDFTT